MLLACEIIVICVVNLCEIRYGQNNLSPSIILLPDTKQVHTRYSMANYTQNEETTFFLCQKDIVALVKWKLH